MSTEVSSPNNEAPQSVDFYNPITDRVKTLEKLTALSLKEPTDIELFEAIADTFATMATIDFEAGVVETIDNQKFKSEEWQHTDEFIFNTRKFAQVIIGYHQPGEGDTVSEKAFIEGVDNTNNLTSTNFLNFLRDSNGLIKVYVYDGEKDEDRQYEIPLDQRKVIVETLLEAMGSKQPL